MRPIQTDIEYFARRFGLRKGVEAVAVIKAVEKVLPQVLPSTLHDIIKATAFNDGVLSLRCPSGSALATLKLYRPAILMGIKKQLGRAIVERIIILPTDTTIEDPEQSVD